MVGQEVGSPAVRELRGLARVLVLASAVGAFALALPGGLGIVFAVPFGAVGALLAIRRPRTSIGWLLLGVAYGFAFVSAPIAATADQFRAGTADLPSTFLAIMTGVSGGATFLLLAILAVVFPSGALPGGRWGRAVRVGTGLGVVAGVLGAVEPTMSVTLVGQVATVRVPNPISVLPGLPIWQVITPDTAILPLIVLLAVAAVSLAVRFRRSVGIERQQIRWLGAALVLVVVAVVTGLVISWLVPSAGESGLAWVPAMIAFPGIPLSILVAVLRYRLYEIDTLINRAIVYGLLTAILAGGSSAAVGIMERLFADVVGPGSDATIVFTTLVVVSAFEPIKKRVQVLVDRRFKEVHSPAAALDAFVADVHGSLARPDPDRTLRGLLAVVARAYRATAVEARVAEGSAPERLLRQGAAAPDPAHARGTPADAPVLVAAATSGGRDVVITIFGSDASTEAAALGPALAAVLAEL